MTKPEHYTESAEARPHGNRAHARRKLSPMAYVELGQENGGILLNLSEGGFAVQSALTLTSREFSELRFQVPAFQGWLKGSGRIVWMSDSKKVAGIQFTELPGEARREIQKWVLAQGVPQKATERFPAPSGGREPSKEIFDTPYRGGGGAHEPAIANSASASGQAEGTTQKEVDGGVAVAEPSRQDFRFPEYSMFAAEPEKEGAWVEPRRHRGNWRGALLGISLAALFFALGATVGWGSVDRWFTYLGGRTLEAWMQNQPAPQVTPPAPPEQAGVAGAAGVEAKDKEPESAEGEDHKTGEEAASPNTGTAGNSEVGKVPIEEKKDAETRKGEREATSGSGADDGSLAGSPTRSAIDPNTRGRRSRHSTENTVARGNSEVGAGPGKTEHSILVKAPGPGSPPFFVNLPGEAVSASAAIAISARRTLEILPSASGRSERVIIGKLISHSEPFYPVEARNHGIEGSVELRARVGRTGKIIGVTPVSGHGLLTAAAVTAVREWRYEPTFVDGDPAETQADVTIVFRLP